MRKEMKTELTKEKILIAAMNEFGTNGYAGASLNNICSTGIAKGLLYHNYENKDALYLACVERCFHTLTEYLNGEDIGNDLQRYVKARLSFFRENENEARLFFESVLQPPISLKEDIAKVRIEFDDFNLDLCSRMLETICLRSDVTKEDAIRYFRLMKEMFNGYFSSPAAHGLSFADTMVTHEIGLSKMLDFMLYGIAKRGEDK
ncbi:MAG: TetR/AcrR family transcriptional regulator [Lachnospiraceae bacterium]|nr:TetR/AcrR family transcriptional regulator [Lachnospiraceae bacterium]